MLNIGKTVQQGLWGIVRKQNDTISFGKGLSVSYKHIPTLWPSNSMTRPLHKLYGNAYAQ
jgi:hypothetical protein